MSLRSSGKAPVGIGSIAVALVAVTCACNSSNPPAPLPGSVVLDWTIDGTKDPARCDASGAVTLQVSLVAAGSAVGGNFAQACAAFATTIDNLEPDNYTGSARLLDSAGNPRTTSVTLAPFDVIGNDTVTVAIDFPASSFF
jgi:hypothetical protein